MVCKLVNTVSWVRLADDLITYPNVDTELFRFPFILEQGSRLIRLSIFGGVDTTINPYIFKALNLFRHGSTVERILDISPQSPYVYLPMNTIEFITMINGGQHEMIILVKTLVGGIGVPKTFYGVNGLYSDYAWQATLEDLGPST
jgi:hypothetical protein